MTVFANSTRDRWLWVLVIAWVVASILALSFLVQRNLRPFDSDEIIAQRYSSVPDYLTALTNEFVRDVMFDQAKIIRVVRDGCRCNVGSRGHWRQLQKEHPNTDFVELKWSTLTPAQQALIPATPMAIYIDEKQSVTYAGPFSDALYCSRNNSLIDAYVSGEATMAFAPLSTQGCFCD